MQIDWWTLGLQTINFGVVIWLLSRFLYRPIRKTIEEREAADRAASAEAQRKIEAAEEARRDYEARRDRLAQEQLDKEAALHEDLEAEREKRLEAARKEAQALLDAAKAKIERDERRALADLKRRILELATDLARTSLKAPSTPQEGLSAAMAHLDHMAPADTRDLQRDLEPDEARLTVITAAPLSDADRTAWRTALTERFGAGVALEFTDTPDILGGVELHFPHIVLRFSVADRLKRAVDTLEV